MQAHGVRAFRAQMGAFFLVEKHGPEAKPEQMEGIVYRHEDEEYSLDDMVRAAIATARHREGWEALTDDEIADRLIAQFALAPEAEG